MTEGLLKKIITEQMLSLAGPSIGYMYLLCSESFLILFQIRGSCSREKTSIFLVKTINQSRKVTQISTDHPCLRKVFQTTQKGLIVNPLILFIFNSLQQIYRAGAS